MDELDGLFNSETPEAIDTAPSAPEPETIGQPRDDSGRFAPKETGDETPLNAEPVPPTGDKLPPETFKAVREEREKRQNLERELEALKQQIQSFQKPSEAPTPPPSIWDDEQAYGRHIQSSAVSQATVNARLDMSEMLASQAHDDFDDMKAKFLDLMGQNPALQQQALAAKHPWEKAYQIAKNAAKLESLGAVDVTDLETKLREQIKAELAAQAPSPAAPALPQSLADAQSSRASAVSANTGLLSLEDILGKR